MINNVVVVSGGQQKDLAIRIHVLFSPQTPLLATYIEQNSMCHTVAPCWLIHFKYSCMYISIPNSLTVPSAHPSPLGSHTLTYPGGLIREQNLGRKMTSWDVYWEDLRNICEIRVLIL